MTFDSLPSQEPAAQVARLEAYIACAMGEIAELNDKATSPTRVIILSDNVRAVRALLLTLIRG